MFNANAFFNDNRANTIYRQINADLKNWTNNNQNDSIFVVNMLKNLLIAIRTNVPACELPPQLNYIFEVFMNPQDTFRNIDNNFINTIKNIIADLVTEYLEKYKNPPFVYKN